MVDIVFISNAGCVDRGSMGLNMTIDDVWRALRPLSLLEVELNTYSLVARLVIIAPLDDLLPLHWVYNTHACVDV